MYKKVKLYSSIALVGLALSSTVTSTAVSAATSGNVNNNDTQKTTAVADDSSKKESTTSYVVQKNVSDDNSSDNTSSDTSVKSDKTTTDTNKADSDKDSDKVANKDAVSTNNQLGPGYYNAGFNLNSWVLPSLADSNFLSQIKAGAIEGWTKYKILPSLTAAQAVLESGNGTSALSRAPFNNLFGIKGTPGKAWRTAEQDSYGNTYYITATFRTYPSFKESIEDHNALLGTSARYRNLVGVKDYTVATARVKADGYATATNYASALNNIIVSDGLTNWDKEAFNESDYPHKAVDVSVITIKTVQNPGVFAYNSNGNAVSGSNGVFTNGSKWKTAGTKVINNQEMFEVATNEYVPIKDTTVGANGVVTINYNSGYGVMGYHLNGSPISGSNSTFKTGTSWATDGAATINGQVMYRVATDEYVPKEYTQFGNGK